MKHMIRKQNIKKGGCIMANDVNTKGDYVDRAEGLMVELHKFISLAR